MKTAIAFKAITFVMAVILVTGCSKETRKARLLSEADTYFKAGNYDKAKVTYLNVLRMDAQSALAAERLGAMWQDDAAPLRAAPFLKKASELDPKNTQNRIRLARCYVAIGAFGEGAREALKVLEQLPDSGEALITLSEAARKKEDVLAAEDEIQKFPKKNDVSFYLASANLFFGRGNQPAALNALRQALSVEPNSPQAHLAMGDLYLFQKDIKQAAEEYKKAAELAPIRSNERLKYAAFKSARGDAEETRRIGNEMTKRAPDYLPGWVLLADVASKEKKYDEALSLLENVFGRDPEYLDARRLQSTVLLAKGETKKAIDALERLDRTYPDTPIIKYELARAYLQNKNMNQAAAALDQALSLNPNYDDASLLLAQINLASGHGEKAIEPLSRLVKKQPDLRSAAFLLGTAYGSLGRFDDAIRVLDEQAKLAPNDAQAQAVLGLTLRQAKRYGEARQAFEHAAQLAPDNLSVLNQLVDLDLLDKHFDAAQQMVRTHFQKNADAPAAHFFQGKILAAEGKWDSAATELRKTLELDPNFSSAYDLLVETYVAANKLPQAASQLEALVKKDPKNMATVMTLALVYDQMKAYEKARDGYEKVLAVNPNFAIALNNLAYLYTDQLNNLDKAYDLARRAHQLQPQDASTSDTLGWVLYKRGEYQQALPILQESAQKAADDPVIQFHLGMTAYMMGQTDLARVALRSAASSTKDFPGKDESKQRLALLESGTGPSSEVSVAQLEGITKSNPNDIVSRIRLGEAYEKAGAPEKAAAAFEQATKLNPSLASAVIKLAELYAGPLPDKQKAIAYAKKARELAPNDPEVTTLLGKVAYQSGNFGWSYSLLQEAARQRRDDSKVLYNLGWAAYAMGKVNEARDSMQKVAAGGDSAETADAKKFLKFTALDQSPNDLGSAEGDVQKELASNSGYVPALMAQAALYAQHGQTKQAIETYTDILHHFPDLAPAQKHLAVLYAEDQSTMTAAYDAASKARKALPDDPELAELLGRLSYQKKEYPRAVQLLQETARKKSLDANSLFYLGMSQLQARQSTEAKGVLNEALTNGLQEPFATEAKRALADLGRQ
jgi:tetratricopeptide (TPR) repeat protein